MPRFNRNTDLCRGAPAPLLLWLPALLLIFWQGALGPAYALGSRAATYTAGFKTITLWSEELDKPLEVGLWYPARRGESDLDMYDWRLSVAHNARPVEGLYPLVLISHDAGGSMLSLHDTAADLARQGFVVAAPTHSLDNFMDTRGIFRPGQILDRPYELSYLLNSLLGTGSLDFIDHRRIGVLGVGVGAATVLSLAGADPDFNAYRNYCAGTGHGEPFCSELAMARFGALPFMRREPRPLPTWRISSIALAAPACGMFFTRQGLHSLTQPCVIFVPESDLGNGAVSHAELLKNNLPALPGLVHLPGLDAADLAAPCNENILDFDGLNCTPPDDRILNSRQNNFNATLGTFFKTTLGDPHPPRAKAGH